MLYFGRGLAQADTSALREILLNLSTNALKYSEAGTPLTFVAQKANVAFPLASEMGDDAAGPE